MSEPNEPNRLDRALSYLQSLESTDITQLLKDRGIKGSKFHTSCPIANLLRAEVGDAPAVGKRQFSVECEDGERRSSPLPTFVSVWVIAFDNNAWPELFDDGQLAEYNATAARMRIAAQPV